MKKTVFSGHQPNFLPYMGIFYKMFQSDIFVLDDDVQYSSKAYHNTNFIKVNGKKFRITIPVNYEFGDPINEVQICYDRKWERKLLSTLMMNYGKARHFDEGYELIERHINAEHTHLADLNIRLIMEIAERFRFGCQFVIASKSIPTSLKKNQRNIYQCLTLGGNVYYSGIGGKSYNDEENYSSNGIRLVYSDYMPIRYEQVGNGFIENLSVLDYIFNKGFKLPENWRRQEP